MTISETLDGSIKLSFDRPSDTTLLTSLIMDSGGSGSEGLVNQVCQHIKEDDWNEFVQPDLLAKYQQDIASVSLRIKEVLDNEKEDLVILSEDFRYWYSTLNQARLNLEETFKISTITEPIENLDHEKVEAMIKSEFYMYLQSLLLDFLKL